MRVTLPPDPVSAPPNAPITVVPPLRPSTGWPQPPVPGPAAVPSQQPAPPAGWSPPPGWPPPQGWPPAQGWAPPPRYRYVPVPPPRPAPIAPNGQPLATFAERLGAYLLDRLILGGVALIPVVVLFFALLLQPIRDMIHAQDVALATGVDPPPPFTGGFLVRYLLFLGCALLVQLAIGYLYDVVYQVRTGQTLGKRVLKIKTIQLAGAPLTRRGATLGWLVVTGGGLVPGFAYLDRLWQLWDKPFQQCLHDKAAQTVVVKLWA